ncbi:alpha/beta hydrolase [Bacteroides sp. OttesenSCG-928-F21]|nr:alpha/beta hydrolase [Bacteroides sp. OttesenSCG-928-F21]
MKEVLKIIFFCFFTGVSFSSAFGIIPNRTYRFYPEKLGLIYKDLTVTTPDGINIKTWFFPAQTALPEKELNSLWENPTKRSYNTIDGERRPTIIICNGDAGNMSYQQLVYAQYFTNNGYNVVTFDWRGFGESSEYQLETDYIVYAEFLTDYDAVIKEVFKQEEVDISKIALFGWSTGAYLSMAASVKYENIKCFIAIGLITSFDKAIPVLKQVPKNKHRNLIIPKNYPKELQPIDLASRYDKSTFLIVGEKDDRSPVWMSREIFNKLQSKKELWVVEGASHTIIDSQEHWTSLNIRIKEFLDKNLK